MPPTIDRFEPSHGAPGSLVTVFGSGFAGHVDVFFGGARAHSFDVPTLTALDQFEIAVPDDARPGPISVLVSTSRGAAAVTSTGAFDVLGEGPHAEWQPAAVAYCVVYAPDCTVVPDAFHQYGCWLAHLDVLCTGPGEPVRPRRPPPD